MTLDRATITAAVLPIVGSAAANEIADALLPKVREFRRQVQVQAWRTAAETIELDSATAAANLRLLARVLEAAPYVTEVAL